MELLGKKTQPDSFFRFLLYFIFYLVLYFLNCLHIFCYFERTFSICVSCACRYASHPQPMLFVFVVFYCGACQSQSSKTKHSFLILFRFLSDECRQIEFGDALSNSRLSKDHVIRVYHVQNEPNCKVKCFLEPDCVAYNYGKNNEGNLQCELCNKSHLQLPSNHVMVTPGFIFRPVAEVFVRVLFFLNIQLRFQNKTTNEIQLKITISFCFK